MKLTLQDCQVELLSKILKDAVGKKKYSKDETEIKELIDIFKRDNDSIEKIKEFVGKYTQNATPGVDEDAYNNTDVLLGGLSYYLWWEESDLSVVYISNFIVDYIAIINQIDKDKPEVFKSASHYLDLFNTFKEKMLNIGVIFYEEKKEINDSLMVYALPVEKILDDKFIEKFSKLIKEYEESFESELSYILK